MSTGLFFHAVIVLLVVCLCYIVRVYDSRPATFFMKDRKNNLLNFYWFLQSLNKLNYLKLELELFDYNCVTTQRFEH